MMKSFRCIVLALFAATVLIFACAETSKAQSLDTVNVMTSSSSTRTEFVRVPVIRNTGPLAWLKHKFGKRGYCLLEDLRDPHGNVVSVEQYRRYRYDYCLVLRASLSKIDPTACVRSQELIAQDRELAKPKKSSGVIIAKSEPPLVKNLEDDGVPTLRTEDVKPDPRPDGFAVMEETPEPLARSVEVEPTESPVTAEPIATPFDSIRTVKLKIGEDDQVFQIKRGESIRFVLEGASEDATIGLWPRDERFIGYQQDYEHYGVFILTGNETNIHASYAQNIVLYPTNWVGKDAPGVKFRLVVI